VYFAKNQLAAKSIFRSKSSTFCAKTGRKCMICGFSGKLRKCKGGTEGFGVFSVEIAGRQVCRVW
jgi:hypothetical protein